MIDLENNRRYIDQWSLDQRVQIDNFLPGTWVEFSYRHDSKDNTLITEAYEEDGHIFADIPNVLMQSFGYLNVYVRPSVNDAAHTPEEKQIKVVRKEKPEHYTYTETPTISYQALAKRIDDIDKNIAQAVSEYLEKNPVELKTDETISMENGVLSVNTTNAMEQDNTLPITSAGVYATVGNIEALLKTI